MLSEGSSRARITFAVLGLLFCVGAVAVATLTPTPLDRGMEATITRLLEIMHHRGVPEWFGYHKLEFSANVLMFLPLGLFGAIALPAKRQWLALLAVPAASAAVELVQATMLSERYGSILDIAANTLGGYIGIGLAAGLRGLVHLRDRQIFAQLPERAAA